MSIFTADALDSPLVQTVITSSIQTDINSSKPRQSLTCANLDIVRSCKLVLLCTVVERCSLCPPTEEQPHQKRSVPVAVASSSCAAAEMAHSCKSPRACHGSLHISSLCCKGILKQGMPILQRAQSVQLLSIPQLWGMLEP